MFPRPFAPPLGTLHTRLRRCYLSNDAGEELYRRDQTTPARTLLRDGLRGGLAAAVLVSIQAMVFEAHEPVVTSMYLVAIQTTVVLAAVTVALASMAHPWLGAALVFIAAAPSMHPLSLIAGATLTVLLLAQRTRTVWVEALLAGGVVLWGVRGTLNSPKGTDPRPDIIVYIIDTMSAENSGLYGSPLDTTPALDAMAREGVVFDRALSTAPWTVPSHASLFTGEHPRDVAVHHQHRTLLDDRPTTAEQLASAGYRTAAFVANPWLDQSGLLRGFEDVVAGNEAANSSPFHLIPAFELLLWSFKEHGEPSDSDPAHKGGMRFVEYGMNWLSLTDGRPSLLVLNVMEPHSPYHQAEQPARFGATDWLAVSQRSHEIQQFGPGYSDYPLQGEADTARLIHAAGIRHADRLLGTILESLEARGRAEETVVVVTADHGESFGEYGYHGHLVGLNPQTLHVPLVLRYPGHLPADTRVTHAVSTRRVHDTLLDLAGVHTSPRSLIHEVENGSPSQTPIVSEHFRPLPFLERFAAAGNTDPQIDYHAVRAELDTDVLVLTDHAEQGQTWSCYDRASDPTERTALPQERCPPSLVSAIDAHLSRPTQYATENAPMSDLMIKQLEALGYLAE